MSKLILVKHAAPEVLSDVPSHRWRLSARGREQAAALAERLRAHAPEAVITSEEPKAVETGEIISSAIGVQSIIGSDLHEHDRSNVPLMRTPEFISAMALFFKRPDERVLGRETAGRARQRITAAIESLLREHEGETIAVVTHGTVLALFAAEWVGADAYTLWRELGLPSYLVLDRPSLRVIERVDRLDGSAEKSAQ